MAGAWELTSHGQSQKKDLSTVCICMNLSNLLTAPKLLGIPGITLIIRAPNPSDSCYELDVCKWFGNSINLIINNYRKLSEGIRYPKI